jgi:hypothetical protein
VTSTISCRCPSCNVRIKAPVQLLGRWRPCPSCNQRFLVRVQPPQDAGPVLVPEEDSAVLGTPSSMVPEQAQGPPA